MKKTLSSKECLSQLNLGKIKNIFITKYCGIMKSKDTEWEKWFTLHISHRGPTSRLYEVLQINNDKSNNPIKWAKYLTNASL
jgi:hypothetical protein